MKDLVWDFVKEAGKQMNETIFGDMWKKLLDIIKFSLKGVYEFSYYVIIILCMYDIIMAMFGSKEAKVRVLSKILIWATIEMIATMLGIA